MCGVVGKSVLGVSRVDDAGKGWSGDRALECLCRSAGGAVEKMDQE